MAGVVGPGHRVGAGEEVAVQAQAGEADAEPVQAQAQAGQGRDQLGGREGGLPAADRAEADERLGGQVDAGAIVQVSAAQVC